MNPLLTREQALKVLATHEWIETDDWKHYTCLTCGSRHRVKTDFKKFKHQPGCQYKQLIDQISRGQVIL